jgi:hypothetical protein
MWLTTRQIAEQFGVATKTAWGWMMDGVLTPAGQRVKLAKKKVGGRWMTRQEWLDAFLRACDGEGVEAIGNPTEESRQGQRDKEEARRALAGT